MKRMLLALCVLVCYTLLAAPSLCKAQEVYGVITEDRVINLPQDQNKWYISIVGQDGTEKYQTLIEWFDTDANLNKLKNQVHFCPITTESKFYPERYEKNIKGLPTVRVQSSNGTVVYEASGNKIPFTPAGLYAAIADGVNQAPKKYILPYRRNHEKPAPSPDPDGKPVDPPAPPLDNDGAPDLDTPEVPTENMPPLALMLGTLILAAGVGVLVELRSMAKAKTH